LALLLCTLIFAIRRISKELTHGGKVDAEADGKAQGRRRVVRPCANRGAGEGTRAPCAGEGCRNSAAPPDLHRLRHRGGDRLSGVDYVGAPAHLEGGWGDRRRDR